MSDKHTPGHILANKGDGSSQEARTPRWQQRMHAESRRLEITDAVERPPSQRYSKQRGGAARSQPKTTACRWLEWFKVRLELVFQSEREPLRPEV